MGLPLTFFSKKVGVPLTFQKIWGTPKKIFRPAGCLALTRQTAGGPKSQKKTEKLGATPNQRIKQRENGFVVEIAPFCQIP